MQNVLTILHRNIAQPCDLLRVAGPKRRKDKGRDSQKREKYPDNNKRFHKNSHRASQKAIDGVCSKRRRDIRMYARTVPTNFRGIYESFCNSYLEEAQ